MKHKCDWCGKEYSDDELVDRMDWARHIRICKDCQTLKDANCCIKCGTIRQDAILINGMCDKCYSELIEYEEKNLNNDVSMFDSDTDQTIDSKDNKVWRNKLFQTTRVQMESTDDSLGEVENDELIRELIKEQTAVNNSCRTGFAMERYGIKIENYSDMLKHSDSLEKLLERYSKKLVLPEWVTGGKKYSLVFVDDVIDKMPLEDRVRLQGEGTHFLLIELDQGKSIDGQDKRKVITYVNKYIERFNSNQ